MTENDAPAPKVSVLLAVYNTNPTHLREAIDSILSQTFTDFELIIVNDASPNDDVEPVILGYTDPRIRYYVNEENLGISPTRNRLIDLSRGEYLAVVDHDDISAPERLAKEVDYLDTHNDVGVVSSFIVFIGKKPHYYKLPVEDADIRVHLMNDCAIQHPAAMIRKRVLLENAIRYEEEYSPAEDHALWCKLIPHTKFHNIPEYLLYYREHASNTSKLQEEKMCLAKISFLSQARIDFPAYYEQYLRKTAKIKRVKLFGKVPFLKLISASGKSTCYLFNKIPLYTAVDRREFSKWHI